MWDFHIRRNRNRSRQSSRRKGIAVLADRQGSAVSGADIIGSPSRSNVVGVEHIYAITDVFRDIELALGQGSASWPRRPTTAADVLITVLVLVSSDRKPRFERH